MQRHWTKKVSWTSVAILVLSLQPMRCGLPTANAEAAQFPPALMMTEAKTTQGYPYVFGGISSDEREAMAQRAKDFNVKLVFAAKSGAFISGVRLTITDAKGTEIAKLTTEGPWFYIRLPAGSYSITATFQGQSKGVKGLRVVQGKQVQQVFVWDLGEQKEP